MGNRTHDLPACSALPQPTVPPRAPQVLHIASIYHYYWSQIVRKYFIIIIIIIIIIITIIVIMPSTVTMTYSTVLQSSLMYSNKL